MVRINSQRGGENPEVGDGTIEYADWMGRNHVSAVEAPVREEVVAANAPSEEPGRMPVFRNGDDDDSRRDELGGVWRPAA